MQKEVFSMPWECKTVNEKRMEFVVKAVAKEDSLSALCREYGISRPTGYKWLKRYSEGEQLYDRPHTPLKPSGKTPAEKETIILDARIQHPTWGPRKLRRYLEDKGVADLPATSTIAAILKRNGFITPEESQQHKAWKRFVKEAPNELWQMDYKGHFAMLDGQRCHPLTMLDDYSRFSLCVDAHENEQWLPTKDSLTRVFREYGLPAAILCDNGSPWADNTNGYTPFEIWMMQMDVLPIHGRPLHPQTQGKEERFHRTMKRDLLATTPIRDLQHAQQEFDLFKYCYNYERPHEALELSTPAKLYKPSTRAYIEHPTEPEYDTGSQLRKVNYKGYISICNYRYYLSESFIGKYIRIIPKHEHRVWLCYGDFVVAKINLQERLFTSRRIYRLE